VRTGGSILTTTWPAHSSSCSHTSLAGGSINARFVPAISIGRRVDHDTIVSVFEAVGVDAQQRHRQRQACNRGIPDDRCIRPRAVSRCDGAPKGTKTDLDAVPAVVWESPKPIRRRFVESYVAHRGVHFETKATTRIQEERPASYLADLHDLIDESVTSTVSRGPVDSRFLQMPLANSGCN